MDGKILEITNEMEQLYCYILLEEIREKVRRLRSYGICDEMIDTILHEEEIFPMLTVTKDYKIVVGEEKQNEIIMEPLVKAIYFLFLLHPEGIILKCLPDYRKELEVIYGIIRPQGLTKRAENSIMNVTNPVQNSINEKCARIRRAFTEAIPHRLLRYYTISGKRGEAKRITLQRDRINWETNIKLPQGL
jgi:hypothetical protein